MTATAEVEKTEAPAGGVGRVSRVIGPVVDVEFPVDQMPRSTTPDGRTTVGVRPGQDRRSPCTSATTWSGHRPEADRRLQRGPRCATPERRSRCARWVWCFWGFTRVTSERDGDVPTSTSEGQVTERGRSTGRAQVRRAESKTECGTGLKVLDLLTQYVTGGKIGLSWRPGVGKTVRIQEMIYRIAQNFGALGVRRRGGAHPRGQRTDPREGGAGSSRNRLVFGRWRQPGTRSRARCRR